MAKIERIQEVAITDLVPYENNAKLHPDDQVQKIADSIEKFGFLTPCLIDDKKNVIAGHGRIEAANKLGIKKVPCVEISHLSEEERRAYILADNRLTELGGWDMDLVAEELKYLDDAGFDVELTGFTIDDEIIDTDPVDDMGIGDEISDMVSDKAPQSKYGEVYRLGEHRLMCGDSTNLDDVLTLTGGELMDLMVTDPPYNVAIENAQGMTIANDNMSDESFYQFLLSAMKCAFAALKPGGGILRLAC